MRNPLHEFGTCSLCGKQYSHYGNNPEPLKRYAERCCDDCNQTKVLPAREDLVNRAIKR